MIKLKIEVNKSKLFREFEEHANKIYKDTYKEEYAKKQYIDGAKDLFELLRLGVVIDFCPICDTSLSSFLDGRRFCKSCLKIYKKN